MQNTSSLEVLTPTDHDIVLKRRFNAPFSTFNILEKGR